MTWSWSYVWTLLMFASLGIAIGGLEVLLLFIIYFAVLFAVALAFHDRDSHE